MTVDSPIFHRRSVVFSTRAPFSGVQAAARPEVAALRAIACTSILKGTGLT